MKGFFSSKIFTVLAALVLITLSIGFTDYLHYKQISPYARVFQSHSSGYRLILLTANYLCEFCKSAYFIEQDENLTFVKNIGWFNENVYFAWSKDNSLLILRSSFYNDNLTYERKFSHLDEFYDFRTGLFIEYQHGKMIEIINNRDGMGKLYPIDQLENRILDYCEWKKYYRSMKDEF